MIQADPTEKLDSWEAEKPKKKPGRPRKNPDQEVPEISEKKPKGRPGRPLYTEANKPERAAQALSLPKDAPERTARLVIHLTPAEEKEVRNYVYKWELPATDWARIVLLDRIRNDS